MPAGGSTAGGSTAGATITARGLAKRFGRVRAVDGVSFDVEPGRVTGFLGPNGAGKTTTLRLVLGLVRPTAGTVLLDGRRYAELDEPQRVVGAALDGMSFDPGRSARDHLRWLAAAGGLPAARCDEVLELVGLTASARRRVGGFSTGMRQRLALAGALLGDPRVLVLDEPANGLDPEGIAWLRTFLRALAAQGRTVVVSSHVLSEVEQTVDEVLVLAAGRLAYAGPLAGLSGERGTVVDSPDRAALQAALVPEFLAVTEAAGGLAVAGADPGQVGRAAHAAGIQLSYLAPSAARLEDAFLRLVARTEAEGEVGHWGEGGDGGGAGHQGEGGPRSDGGPQDDGGRR